MSAQGKKTSAILVLALCFTAIDAQACGEVMYRMGGALRYHAFITRHPAEILIYAGPAALQHTSADAAKFHENLEKAGHRVTVVNDADGLAQALSARPYDVIITYAGDVDSVTSQIAKASREPTLIPVIDRSAPNEREMRERFPRLVTEDANLNQFLKVIEQSMQAKGA
jgi:protein-L-isoaspartate O-methyltransferase